MLMPELVQDVLVTIIAMACGLFIVRRVLGIVRPTKSAGCSNCSTTKEPSTRPLRFVSPKR
jgi:hypothetical protein